MKLNYDIDVKDIRSCDTCPLFMDKSCNGDTMITKSGGVVLAPCETWEDGEILSNIIKAYK